jgi:hypothetical protein
VSVDAGISRICAVLVRLGQVVGLVIDRLTQDRSPGVPEEVRGG